MKWIKFTETEYDLLLFQSSKSVKWDKVLVCRGLILKPTEGT